MHVGTGATLDTVLLGPLLESRLRYWAPDGTPHLVTVDDAAAFGELTARGLLARTSPEPGRFREVALRDAWAATLYLVERPVGRPEQPITASGAQFVFSEAVATSGEDLWRAAADWWRDAYQQAARRGEFLVIEPGGWEAGSEPYVLALVGRGDDGGWASILEAAPAPVGSMWPPTREPGATIRAPLSAETLAVSGLLIADAVRTWVSTPFDTVITYGVNPVGPVPGTIP